MIVLWAIDCLMNAMVTPIFLVVAGALAQPRLEASAVPQPRDGLTDGVDSIESHPA
jgi:hypothetical protein